MSSFYLVLNSDRRTTGKTHDFIIKYSPSINLDRTQKYEIALVDANVPNSWYNIAASNGNNTLRYHNGDSVWKTITFSDGQYSVSAINSYIQSKIDGNGDTGTNVSIVGNTNTLKVDITLSNNYVIDLSNNGTSTFYSLLGFTSSTATLTTNQTTSSPGDVDITNGINGFVLHCDLVDYGKSYIGNTTTSAIYSFNYSVSAGYNEHIEPNNLLWLPLNKNINISSVHVYITDQNNNVIDLNGEPMNISVYVRQSK